MKSISDAVRTLCRSSQPWRRLVVRAQVGALLMEHEVKLLRLVPHKGRASQYCDAYWAGGSGGSLLFYTACVAEEGVC